MIAGSPRWPPRRAAAPAPGPSGLIVFPRPRGARLRFFGRLAALALVVAVAGGLAGWATGSPVGPGLAAALIAAAGALYTRRWRRTIRRVELSRDGLTTVTYGGRRVALRWDQVAWVETRLLPLVAGLRLRVVRLRRLDGAALVLPGDLVGLDELIRLVEQLASGA